MSPRRVTGIGLLMTTTLIGSCVAETPPGPIAVFDATSVDVGRVLQGQSIQYTFRIKNVGRGDLVIEGLDLGCYCTAAHATKERLRAGENGEVAIDVSTTRSPGAFQQGVLIKTNDKRLLEQWLWIKATVDPEFNIDTHVVDFSGEAPRVRLRKRVAIDVDSRSSAKLLRVSTSGAPIETRLERLGERQYEVVVWLSQSLKKPLRGNILIETSSRLMPRLAVPVRGQPAPDEQ